MPLNRVELIARGFAHADKAYPGGMPLNSLMTSPHLNGLSPDEKIQIIHRFDELTVDSKHKGGPGFFGSVGGSAGTGALSATTMAALGGLLTVPTREAISAANKIGGVKPWLAIGKKFSAPLALAGGVGALAGTVYGASKHFNDMRTNRYMNKSLDLIRNTKDPHEKSIATMSLLATSPIIAGEHALSTAHRDAGMGMAIGSMLRRENFEDVLPSQTYGFYTDEGDENPRESSAAGFNIHPATPGMTGLKEHETEVKYDDWRAVNGLGVVDPALRANRAAFARAYAKQQKFNSEQG